jgi:hypothetical protein
MAEKATLDELIAALSQRDALRIHKQLLHRFDAKQGKVAPFTSQEDDFYTALHRVMNGRLLPKLELATHKKIHGRNGYKRAATQLFTTLKNGSDGTLRRPQMLALAYEALSCLAEAMEEWGIPVSAANLIMQIDNNLEHALNEAYPGYLENRMLHYLAPMLEAA